MKAIRQMTALSSRTLNGRAEAAEKPPTLLASRWSVAAFIILSLTLVCLTGRDGLLNLYDRWAYEDEYGYGFLTAALVPLLLWRRWHLVRALSNDTKWPGLVLVIVAQLCGVLGALGESYFVEQIAFVLTLLGLMLVVFGIGTFEVFAPLAALLLLTIPLPYTVQAMVTVKLQLLSTDIGVAVIRLFGIPVFVEGNIIDLGQFKLQVAEACSGLRYLLPLTCISFILAYLYKAPLWKRAIIVASAAPITVLINSFRIAVIAVLVDRFGKHMAEGFLHQFEGWVIFLVGALLLGAVMLGLERFRFTNIRVGSLLDSPTTSSGLTKRVSLSRSAIAAAFVCASAFGLASSITWAHEFAPRPARDSFVGFPRQIGEWSAREGQLEPAVLEILKATDTYIGNFANNAAKAAPINLLMVYYDSLAKGAAIHSPRVCMPGSGWEFASFEENDFRELAPATPGTFNRVIIQKGDQRGLMYYWFQQRERRTANEFSMKYYLLMDSLKKQRKDGALIRIYTPILPGEKGLAEADHRLHAFAEVLLPRMTGFLPQ
jgi:exosortase D (VPLPA-CTERM-specific)